MKKLVIAVIAAVVVGIIAVKLFGGGDGKGQLISEAHDSNKQGNEAPVAIDIYVDASGSMKGYVDGVTGTFKTNIPDLTVNPTNNKSFGLSADSISCFTINNKNVVSHETNQFCDQIRDKSLFNGQSTELHDMFDVVARSVIAKPNHVAIIVSDCILSFPHKDIVANPQTNIQNIGILESNVTRSMTQLVNANLSVAIVQYKSDFNGSYYYDYKDVPLTSASGKIMKDRPYYLIMVGKKANLEAMFNKNALPAGNSGVYMYNAESAQPKMHVIRAQKSGAIAAVKENVPEVKVSQKGDNAYFYLGIEDFPVAAYLEPLDQIMKSPVSRNNIISTIEQVSYNDVNNDKNIGKNEIKATYFYRVTLKSGEELKNISDATDDITFNYKALDANISSIDNDEVQDPAMLDGKTFMFSHLISAIEKAYLGAESAVAKVKINITKIQ